MPSEREIAEAICSIFQALEKLHRAGMKDSQGSRVRREAVHFLWELREGDKLGSQRPHSRAAWDYRQRGMREALRYEHSIPVAAFMPVLRTSAHEVDLMCDQLKRYVRPVIVLEEECRLLSARGLNARLPDGAKPDDAFARYRAVDIEMMDNGA